MDTPSPSSPPAATPRGLESMRLRIEEAVSSHLHDSMQEQPMPSVQLLPKPKYSSLPEHNGKKLVFVIDGDTRTAEQVSELLDCQPDFVVTSAPSGEAAMLQLEQLPYLPNCILLARRLPGVGGRQVCTALRKVYSMEELPIIKLLPRHMACLATQATLDAGTNNYIIKPIGQVELLLRLNTHMVVPQLAAAEVERQSNYQLLQAILPPRIIQRLKAGSKVVAEQHEQVTILFSDVVDFTTMSHELPTEFIINMLEELFSAYDECCDKHGICKVETIGDAYMCVTGHEGHCDDHALRMIDMAESMLHATERVGKLIGRELQIRIGIHTVNTASRMESSSFPMCIHFSQATRASLDRAWMLRSLRNTGGGAPVKEEKVVREHAPASVSLGARYQKGKGLVISHLLKVGRYREAVKELGLPDPDQLGSTCPRNTDMHAVIRQASAAAAVVGTLHNEARKALSDSGILSGAQMKKLTLRGALMGSSWRTRDSKAGSLSPAP